MRRYSIARPEEVHALARALPERYRAIVYLAAGCGWRGGEIFGLDRDGLDFEAREVQVRHQLTLRWHLATFPIRPEEIEDETTHDGPSSSCPPACSPAAWPSDPSGGLVTHMAPRGEGAGLPSVYGLRDLRHYFATVLIYGGANVKSVQLAMGHTTPTSR